MLKKHCVYATCLHLNTQCVWALLGWLKLLVCYVWTRVRYEMSHHRIRSHFHTNQRVKDSPLHRRQALYQSLLTTRWAGRGRLFSSTQKRQHFLFFKTLFWVIGCNNNRQAVPQRTQSSLKINLYFSTCYYLFDNKSSSFSFLLCNLFLFNGRCEFIAEC